MDIPPGPEFGFEEEADSDSESSPPPKKKPAYVLPGPEFGFEQEAESYSEDSSDDDDADDDNSSSGELSDEDYSGDISSSSFTYSDAEQSAEDSEGVNESEGEFRGYQTDDTGVYDPFANYNYAEFEAENPDYPSDNENILHDDSEGVNESEGEFRGYQTDDTGVYDPFANYNYAEFEEENPDYPSDNENILRFWDESDDNRWDYLQPISAANFKDPNMLIYPDITNFYNVVLHKSKVHELGVGEIDLSFTFKNLDGFALVDEMNIIHKTFENLFNVMSLRSTDKYRIVLRSSTLDRPISIPFVSLDAVDGIGLLMDCIKNVLNSNKAFELNGAQLNVIHIPFSVGSSKKKSTNILKRRNNDIYGFITKMRSVIQNKSPNDTCLGGAMYIGMQYILMNCQEFKNFLANKNFYVNPAALKIHTDLNLLRPCSVNDIHLILNSVNTFKDVSVYVFDVSKRLDWIKVGNGSDKICLLYTESTNKIGHFDTIKPDEIHCLFGAKFYCWSCMTAYTVSHKCINASCRYCCLHNCQNTAYQFNPEQKYYCKNCNSYFSTNNCLSVHQCTLYASCHKCHRKMQRCNLKHHLKNNLCFKFYCNTCKKNVKKDGHPYCFISKWEDKNIKAHHIFFYDFECYISEDNYLLPNLICVCDSTGNMVVFRGFQCVGQFMAYIQSVTVDKKATYSFLCHNASGFDNMYLLRWFYDEGIETDIIVRNQRVIAMSRDNIRFLDSYLFINIALDKFQKAFDIESGKGHFPHMLNAWDTQDYDGEFPHIKYFQPDNMSSDRKKKFLDWYTEEKAKFDISGQNYCMLEQLEAYCIQDVEVLRQGCLKFRDCFKEITGLDIFQISCTIPSASHIAFRQQINGDEFINVSDHGLKQKNKPSGIANCYLNWLEYKTGIFIVREKKVPNTNYSLDGHCCTDQPVDMLSNQLGRLNICFRGCWWHGCPKCFPSGDHPLLQVPFSKLHEKTMRREEQLTALGYKPVVKYECQFKNDMIENDELADFIKRTGGYHTPIKPRDAFFGGRTNVVRLFYECKPDEKIIYVDINSLYPHVLCDRPFPVGIPEVKDSFMDGDVDISSYFGIAKVTVLPPKNLWLPILPVRHGKTKTLMFPLCRTCCEQLNHDSVCVHNNQQRQLEGTWCTEELKKAITKGYKILKIHEVWTFSKSPQSPFRPFLKQFIGLKYQSSGFSPELLTENQKTANLEEFNNLFDLDIQYKDVIKNESMRSLAKFVLNSFWGRFSMKQNVPNTKMITSHKELMNLLVDKSYEIQDLMVLNEKMLLINYKKCDLTDPVIPNLSLLIGIFTCCWARLELYSHAEKLQNMEEQLLYFDTDSLFYIKRPQDVELATGGYQGQLKDEVLTAYSDPNIYINQFVATAPKSYAYQIVFPNQTVKSVCHIKGIPMSCQTEDKLNFDVMKNLILYNRNEKIQITKPHQFKKNKNTGTIKIYDLIKTFSLKYDKRIFNDVINFKRYPWGYI